MNRLKLLAAAMLLAVPIACGDEVLPPPPTGSIDGLVSIEGQGIDAVSVTLSNGASATTANGGMFRFDGVEAGAYTVTISNYPADASFDQTSAAATIATDGETVTINFPGTFIRTSSIMGTVTVENEGLSGITVKISGTGDSETLTDGNGQYAFTGLRAGNYTIEISGFDDEDVAFGSTASSATLAAGESKVVSFEGTYLRTSGIRGQVTADDQPQELVTVSLQGRGENRSMTTNSAGQYSFDELRSGDYAIGISGYSTDEMSFDVTSKTVTVAYGETATLPFEGTLLRTAGIMGTVTVEGFGPIEDVTVTIQGQGENKSMPTNSAGEYSFNRLHAGDYSVTISGFDDDEYGFDVTTATVTVALQDTETVAFDGIMLRTAGISGEVTVGDDDAPLSGVTVTVSGGPKDEDHSATTHSDGTYLVENLHAGDYSVVISGYDTREYGFDPTTETVSVGLRETLEVAFQGELLRTAGVSGRVSVNGMGIPGVTVTLTGEEDRDPENTNADGQFGFSGLAAGDYTLTISGYDAVEYAFEPTREFELELDESEIMNFTGRALRTATVMGYVTVGDAPLPGIDVTLIMVVGTSGEIVGAMPTGETGGYTFGPLLAGAYQVRIGEYDDEYDFAAGDMQVTAVMTDSTATVNFAATIIRTASVSGRVTIAGDPMKDVTVTLTGDNAPDDNSRMTGDYGMYEFDDLRKGDYTLTISGYDAVDYHFEPTRESFALELGGSAIKNFTGKALRTATVMGYVTVEEAPLPGIDVTLIMVVGTSGEIVDAKATGDNGGYTFGPLLAGAYQVRIGEYDDEYDFAAGDMQVTAVMTDSTATVNFAATIIRTAMVSGMVTIDGEAMKDIEVTLTGEHAPDDNSKMTGVDGSYSFDELRKGDYTVTMTNPDGNAYSFPTVATPVNLGVGQEQPGISFAGTRLKRASISGQVHAAGDPVANVTVTLSGDATGEDMTDANGEYNFPGLAIGSYTVTISGWAEAAYIFDDPASDAEIVNNDDFLIVDFEGEHTKTASISGMLFIDEGGQTALARDAGEPVLDLTGVLPEGMTGLPLTLLGPELTSPPTAGFASREGMYSFGNLRAGTYVINVDVETVIDAETEATVEDLLARLGYEYTGPSLILVSVAAAEEKTDVNLPFKITLQTINVGAVMGTPDDATATLVGGVKLALYPTAEAADAGTPILGTATTDSTTGAAATFHFPRAMDLGPGGTGNDHLVFAKVMDEGHADLEFSDNKEIEIQYAATDRVDNALTAARLVNVQVNFQWWVKSNETAKDGDEPLGGWVANNGMETDATGLAMFSERLEVPDAIAGKTYEVMLNEEQDDRVSGEEMWVPSDALEHTHNHLLLPEMNTAEINDLTAIRVTWETQTLTVGVYREADDVEGYTDYRSALPRGDHRPHADVAEDMSIELLARDSRNRLRRYEWDPDPETGEYEEEGIATVGDNGMVSFTGIPADAELTVRFHVGGSERMQVDYGYDEIETFGDDLEFGSTVGSFGEMSGAGPEVRVCSASEGTTDDECATFGYQWMTGEVNGNVGDQSDHVVVLEAETGHGATGYDTETEDGAYSFTGLQDGEYSATATGAGDYSVDGAPTQNGKAVYHDEFADETGEDRADATWVGRRGQATARWNTTRGGLSIMGYVANDGDNNNLIRGDEAMAGITVRLLTDVEFDDDDVLDDFDVVTTTETAGNGFYSFSGLDNATDYWVQVVAGDDAGGYRNLSGDNPNLSGELAAGNYAALPEESTYRKPTWDRARGIASNTRVPITDDQGTTDDEDDDVSATLHNFALVYTNGTVAGAVNNWSGSSANIDVRITTTTDSDALWERATGRSGDFEVSGVIEGTYTAVIEDAGFEAPCMDAGKADDDAPVTDHDDDPNTDEQCTYAAEELTKTVEGRADYESLGTLHVYSTRASAADELTALEVMGTTSTAEDAEATELSTYDATAVTQEDAGTNDIGTSVENQTPITWASETVTVKATVSEDASYTVKIGTESFAVDEDDGAEVTLPFHATGAADAGTALASTIMISVTGKNGYNDHDYTFTLSRAAPVGYTLVEGDVSVDGNALSGGSGDGLSTQTAWTAATAAGETTAAVVVGLDVITGSTDCGQTVVVKDGDVVKKRDEDSSACLPEYTLSGSSTGNLHTIAVTSQDNKTEIYYLWVNNTPDAS